MKITLAISILCIIFFFGCSKNDRDDGSAEISIDFVYDIEHLNRSPEVHLKNVPAETDNIEINFICDLLLEPNNERGGGSLPYDGSGIIPAGTFNPFHVPISHMGTILKLKATVEAFDKDSKLVGKGTVTQKPPNQ